MTVNKPEQLKKIYKIRKPEIVNRLNDFKKIWNSDDKTIFSELCFCILTPQSKAESCDSVICELTKNKLLFKGSPEEIMPYVKRARFYRNKSRYIVEARERFQNNSHINIKNKINSSDIINTREWLVKNIKGIGYKEAGHFLRNIGLGQDLAILDIHILRNLKNLGVIDELPKTLTPKKYFEIEERLRKFSKKIKIPMAHLDLLFWSMGTGKIFK